MSRAIGVSEEQLRNLHCYQDSPAFAPLERLVLDLAVAMARAPADVPAEITAELRKHFDEAQIVELAAVIAWENYRARFNRVFGVQPSGFSEEGAFCVLPEPGAPTTHPRE